MKKIYPLLTVLCGITFSSSVNAQLEYKDVAHIFYSRCTSCHHEGQHGQSMMNYSETFPWAASIKHDLLIGKMPPWSPDTSYSRFDHERIITQSEKNDIIIWIDGGALKGDTSLAPIAPIYAVYKLNGTPDAILKIPVFTSNASSVDSYVCFSIPSGLTQDRILRAYEIVPGNPAIVHHVLVNVDTSATTTSDLSGGCFTISGDFGIGGYAPGAPPTVFPGEAPLKAGIRIKAGSKMVLQIHYPTGTAGQIDSTQIRLYYYPLNTTGVRPIYNSVPLQNWSLYFPPNTTTSFSAHYPSSGTILAPLSMFAAFPHSHKVCTSIVNYAFSGTDTIPLIRIKKWDFNWQGYYTFSNLVKVPAGYKLMSTHVFDNTVNNPNNPNSPPALVIAGTSTSNEMLFDAFLWFYYQPGDDTINVSSILANDPLLAPLSASVKEIPLETGLKAYVYPNPASDKVTIHLSAKAEYKVCIFNINGQNVFRSETSGSETTIDVKKLPAGMYTAEVTDNKTKEKITKKIILTK